MGSHSRFSAPIVVVTALAALVPAFGQGFVEKAAGVGLVHRFHTGLDRVGNWAPMCDWTQQGVALGDLDGDLDLDVVAVSRMRPNSVFRNDGGVYSDVSALAQIDSTGFDNCATLGDYDRDGDLDLFVGALEHGEDVTQSRSRLYRNDGDFAFHDVTAVSGTFGAGHTMQATFVDLDLDGMLDLLTAEFHGTPNRYYRNEGDGSFSEMAASLGLDTGGSVHVNAFFDIDGDGLLDVLPGTDWKVSNAADLINKIDDVQLQGQPDGTFADVTAGSSYSKVGAPNFGSATMGIAVGDVDYDGDFDCYQTQVNTQFLMINNGWPSSGLPWVQAQDAYGVTNLKSMSPTGLGQTVGWGCVFFDADLDPWLDLFKVNGHVNSGNPRDQQNYFFQGRGPGAGFSFVDQTASFGLAELYDARGIAWGDMDGDGDVDLFTCPPHAMLRYYENNVDRMGNGWVAVQPICGTSAPGGFGVKASWTDALGYPHVRQIGADGVTAGQSEYRAHFGIGLEPSIDLAVEFPSGMTLSFPAVAPNTQLTAIEPVMVELPARVLPASPAGTVLSPGVSGPAGTAAVTGPLAQRGFPVVVHAYAQDGTPLDGSAAVSIVVEGLTPIGPVQHVSGNTFVRRFALAEVQGRHSVVVSFDGWEPRVRPTIAFRGPMPEGRTTTLVVPEAVRAGSADLVDVVVVPRDAGGRLVPANKVVISAGTAIPPTELAPQGDGSFAGTIPAPAVAGTHLVQAVVDGAVAGQPATLVTAGAPFGPTSLFYDEDPNPNVAMLPHELKVLVTPRDLFGRSLGPGTNLQVNIQPGVGSTPVTLAAGVLPPARVGGDFFYVLEKPVGSPDGAAFGTLQFVADGIVLFSKSFNF